MTTQILRIPRTDSDGLHILLRVSPSGRHPLDLKLIGTQHEHIFYASLKESNVNNLQSSHFTGDLHEWKALLRYVLLHERPEGGPNEAHQAVEMVAAIDKRKVLTVTIRKNVGGITQRLGSIRLDEDTEREEVSPFDWTDTAVANADALRAELEALRASVSSQKDNVTKLNQQLDDLVKAKQEHEDELLQKFAALLNEKKLKIRDQQRLLNGAKIDPDTAKEVRQSRDGKGRRPAASRGSKRRANGASAEPAADDDHDDEEDDEEEAALQQQETPAPSDQETEDEGGFDEAPVPAASTKRKSPPIRQSEPSSMDVDGPQDLPPRRELPFSRDRKGASKQPEPRLPSSKQPDEDEDETDEEL